MIQKIKLLREFHPFAEAETFQFKPLTLLVGDQGAGKSTLMELIMKYQKPELAAVNDRFRDKFKDNVGQDGFKKVMSNDDYSGIVELSYTGDLMIVYVDCEKHNPRMSKGEFTKEYKDALVTKLQDDSLGKIIQTMDGYKSTFPDKELMNRMTNKIIENVGAYFQQTMKTNSYLGDENEFGMDMTMAFATTMVSHGQTIWPMLNSLIGTENKVIMFDEPETALSLRSQKKLAELILELSKKNQMIVATHSSILMNAAGSVLSLEHRRWMDYGDFVKTQMV